MSPLLVFFLALLAIVIATYLIARGAGAMAIEPKGIIVGVVWIIGGILVLIVCLPIIGAGIPGI